MTASQRPVVDKDTANINVHGRSGLEIVWKVRTKEGDLLDLSDRALVFEVGGWLRVATTPGEDAFSRRLTVTREEIATLPLNFALNYALHDESVSPQYTLCAARLIVFGFNSVPTATPAVTPGPGTWSSATVTIEQTEGAPVIVVTHIGATGYLDPATLSTLQSTDTSLNTRISTEEVTRGAADASLTSRLSTEEVTRAAGDASLTSRLSTEEVTRAAADASLTARVSTVETGYLAKSGGVMTGALQAVAGVVGAVAIGLGAPDTGFYAPSAGKVGIAAQGQNVATYEPGIATVAGVVRPDADATRDLGTASARWRDGWFSRNLTVGTSFVAPLGTVGVPSYTFSGDSDTGMWSPAANTWAVSTGGVEGVRLNSNQNFGIGTDDPTRRLSVVGTDVNGNFADFKNASDAVLAIGSTANGGRLQAYANGYAGVASLLLNADGGNVGIGINPSTKLHVAGVTTLGGDALFSSDNTYDIGGAANRVRNLYVGITIRSPSLYLTSGDGSQIRGVITTLVDGIIHLFNGTTSGFTGIKMGGITASQPYLKVNGANLQGRLADDTDFNRFQAKLQTHANAVAETPTATHTLTLYDAAGTAYKVLAVAA